MNIVKNWGVLLVIAGALSGCGQEHDHKGRTPLVEVAGEYLYKEDLQAALPFHISKDDSVLFAEHYIKKLGGGGAGFLIKRKEIFPITQRLPS